MKTYPATFTLLTLSILLQILITLCPNALPHLSFVPAGGLLGWLGLVTHQVAHGSWDHLIGNYTYGLPFMLYLEAKIGKKRFIEAWLICGTAAALCQLALTGAMGEMVGSSGAIMGMQAMACMVFGEAAEEKVLGGVYAFLMLLPQLQAAPLSVLTGIAVYAHIGGFVAGVMLAAKDRYNGRYTGHRA